MERNIFIVLFLYLFFVLVSRHHEPDMPEVKRQIKLEAKVTKPFLRESSSSDPVRKPDPPKTETVLLKPTSKPFNGRTKSQLWKTGYNANVLLHCQKDGKKFNKTIREFIPSTDRLLVVGNGPSSKHIDGHFEDYDKVVRFNKAPLGVHGVGTRTDVHVVNQHVMDFHGPLVIFMECYRRRKDISERSKPGQTFCTVDQIDELCRQDPSRGFLFLCIGRTASTVVTGFDEVRSDRSNHYYEKVFKMRHNMNIEHGIIKKNPWPVKKHLGPVTASKIAHTVSKDTKTEKNIDPEMKNSEVVIFILSRRNSFETRDIIRRTWASKHKNVLFAVGSCCNIPPEDRIKWTCTRSKTTNPYRQKEWSSQCKKDDERIHEEKQKYNDIIQMSEFDVYRHLPQKLKYCYKWGIENTNAKWFVKTDDDSVVRISTLEHYLKDTYNPNDYIVIGKIANGWPVPRRGKWAEPHYRPSKYPKFPVGSVGHIVSRKVSNYIVENSDSLFNYQGEDVSIGIWLNESPLKSKVIWKTSKHMTNNGNCKDTSKWVIGHNIKPAKMQACFAHKDEVIDENKIVDKSDKKEEIKVKVGTTNKYKTVRSRPECNFKFDKEIERIFMIANNPNPSQKVFDFVKQTTLTDKDIVVRFNNGMHIDWWKGRTDLNFFRMASGNPSGFHGLPKGFSRSGLHCAINLHPTINYDKIDGILDCNRNPEAFEGQKHPSSGFAAIVVARNNLPNSDIYLLGFDFHKEVNTPWHKFGDEAYITKSMTNVYLADSEDAKFVDSEDIDQTDCPFKPPSISSQHNGGWFYSKDLIAKEHVAFDEGFGKALMSYLGKTSLYDIGAGVGQFEYFLNKHKSPINVKAFDGGNNIETLSGQHTPLRGNSMYVIPDNICWIDASVPTSLPPRPWVLSVEVGEHIAKRKEQTFIDNLISWSSKGIIITWAKKGQHGHGHVNEQNNGYIIRQFEKRGLIYDKSQSTAFRRSVSKLPWLRNTIMVFKYPEIAQKPSCAIVLNSGVLLKHTDGPQIDSYDWQIRFNMLSIKDFEDYVGAKTTHQIVHFSAVKGKTPGRIFSEMNDERIIGVTFPWQRKEIAGYDRWKTKTKSKWIMPSKNYISDCNRKVGLSRGWCSSGMVTTLWAMDQCSSVTVFGGIHDPCYPYHYNQPKPATCTARTVNSYFKSMHDFDAEHKLLQKMHQDNKIILYRFGETSKTNLETPKPNRKPRHIYIDLGANWCNTLDMYKEINLNMDDEIWEIYAFEASPFLQRYVNDYVDYKNGIREEPIVNVPRSGSSYDLASYGPKYGCRGSMNAIKSCIYSKIGPELKKLKPDPYFVNNANLIDSRKSLAAETPIKTRYVHIPAAAGNRDGSFQVWGDEKSQLIGGVTSVNIGKWRAYTVPVVDVVTWIRTYFSKDDFIVLKMDIEGAEFPILNEMLDNNDIKNINYLLMECHSKGGNCNTLRQRLRRVQGLVLMEEEKDYKLHSYKNFDKK